MKDPSWYTLAYERRTPRPHETRCTTCGGLGWFLERETASLPRWNYNHCMQCVGTGLTPICSAELIKGRNRDKSI